MPTAVLPDFRDEFEAEHLRWLRRRFLWFAGLGCALFGAAFPLSAWLLLIVDEERAPWYTRLGAILAIGVQAVVFAAAFRHARRAGPPDRAEYLRLVKRLIIATTVLSIVPSLALSPSLSAALRAWSGMRISVGPAGPWMLTILGIHLLASLLMPWTPREAFAPVKPFVALFIILVLIAVALGDSGVETIPIIVLAIAITLGPGLLVCWVRHSGFVRRFQARAFRDRYLEMSGELVSARRVHEGLFPAAILQGAVGVNYAYEPMRQIGGDFLFVWRDDSNDPNSAVNLALIDVTGHGVAAALTVNRLYGELKRIIAGAAPTPGAVLAELNRYVALTLSSDNIFATALCIRAAPNSTGGGTLEWASAGHPPAVVRRAGGGGGNAGVERLEATTFVLGAALEPAFDPAPAAIAFRPGDAVLACTDGAIEALVRERGAGGGSMLGIGGWERLAADSWRAEPDTWAAEALRQLRRARDGGARDDTLIVALWRPVKA